jgi:hypothetical protein
VDLPCEFCVSRGIANDCWKRKGPKTEGRLIPSRPITIYDPLIDQEERQELQYLYSLDYFADRGMFTMILLAKQFCWRYGLSITHRGLRHAMLANAFTWHGHNCQLSKRHLSQACKALSRKVKQPAKIDEGDLFSSFLVALWYEYNPWTKNNFTKHAWGILAIMKHLCRTATNNVPSTPFAAFWPLVRDEILRVTESLDGRSVSLYAEFREILGPKTIEQRYRYEKELLRHSTAVFAGNYLASELDWMVARLPLLLSQHETIYMKRLRKEYYHIDPHLESLLVDSWAVSGSTIQQGLEAKLEPENKTVRQNSRESSVFTWWVCGLVGLLLLRLSTRALGAVTITQGLCSSEAIADAKSIISICKQPEEFARDSEMSKFPDALFC